MNPLFMFHISHLFTYFAVICGVSSFIIMSENLGIAAGLLCLAGFFDFMDGRFARLFPRTKELKKFGVEIDSLVDAVIFGPLLLAALYENFFPKEISLEVIAIFSFYLISLTTRLGFFNISSREGSTDFKGMPSTLNALIFSWILYFDGPASIVLTLVFISSILMILPFPLKRPSKFLSWILIFIFLASSVFQITQGVFKS